MKFVDLTTRKTRIFHLPRWRSLKVFYLNITKKKRKRKIDVRDIIIHFSLRCKWIEIVELTMSLISLSLNLDSQCYRFSASPSSYIRVLASRFQPETARQFAAAKRFAD